MVHRALSFILSGMLVASWPAFAIAEPPAALVSEIAGLSRSTGGVVGVAAWRLDGKGPRILVNAGEPFPMASTFKIAVAGAVLAAVDEGRITLDEMVTIAPEDHIPSAIIAERLVHPGISLSIANLLELMLTESDNTAADVLMDLAGGAAAVTGWVEKQGIRDQRIDRDTEDLLRDFFKLPSGPFLEAVSAAEKADPELMVKGSAPNPDFDSDPRDTSTPQAMGELLTRIFNGQALGSESTELLIAIMQRCRTGEERLKGRLPSGTTVAHKTGTIGGTTNDAGVITLPFDSGHIVIAVFIKESDQPFAARDRVIAEIARSVRDFLLFADVT